jgi:hypothetical protein
VVVRQFWWKNWFAEKHASRRHGGDLLEVGEMGRSNWEKTSSSHRQGWPKEFCGVADAPARHPVRWVSTGCWTNLCTAPDEKVFQEGRIGVIFCIGAPKRRLEDL